MTYLFKLTSKRDKGDSFSPLRKVFATLVAILMAIPAFAQSVDVSGTVLDDQGEPLIGVTVMVEGTSNGTATDFDGNYSIKGVPSKGKLVFSYIGYAQQIIDVKGRTRIDVKMSEDSQALDELVVVGYGQIRKADLTGSVSVVDAGQITAKGSASVLEALQGSVPGVNITKSSGRTNGGIDIEIRGKSSINSDLTPLYVVDGVQTSDISFLNPQDIERVDILKDASSTAIYGSRATAGVVMITTKSGAGVSKGTKAKISYDGYYGISHATRMPDFMDGKEFYRYRLQKFVQPASGTGVFDSPQPIYGMTPADLGLGQALLQKVGADWESPYVLKEMLANDATYFWPGLVTQDGHQQNHYVSVSGAGESVNYHFGLGYENVQGLYKGDSKGTYSFKGSVDAKINKVISAGFNVNLAQINNSYANSSAISDAYRVNPFMIPYDEDGNNYQYPGDKTTLGTDNHQFSAFKNPLNLMKNAVEKRKTYRLLANIYAQFNIINGLTFKTTISPTYTSYRNGQYVGYTNPDTGNTWAEGDNVRKATVKNQTSYGWTWDNVLSYIRTFGDHSINAMALYSAEKGNTETYTEDAVKPLESTAWWNLATGTPGESTVGSSFSELTMESVALRANYSWKSRYMLTATVRWDGSSKFADGNRWGCFPSVALGWNIAEEAFLQKWWLNNLKLRASYGVTGNNRGIGNYATIVGVNSSSVYPFGGDYIQGFYPSGIVDRDIRWESSHEFNVGLDFGFLNNRIVGSLEWYTKKSKDLLYKVTLPLESGGQTMTTNVGSVRNTGVEFTVTTTNIDTKDWTWTTTLNFAHNNNKVLQINGVSDQIIGGNASSCLFVGHPVNNVYAYAWDGIISDRNMTVPDTPIARDKGLTPGSTMRECDYYYTCYGLAEGQPIIRDVNGDGEWNDEDRVISNGNPKFTAALTSNLTYRLPKKGGSIDFGFSIYAKQGYTVASSFVGGDAFDLHDRGRGKVMVDSYIPAGMLVDADGVRPDGTFINPVYQTETHYGSWPIVNSGASDGLGRAGSYFGLGTDTKFCARQVVDASFWKVQHVSLGYEFSKQIIEKIGCSRLRLYCNISNPFVWSKYKGFDPEWANASSGNDGPSTITYEFGANITF